MRKISIVTPCYNEELNVDECYEQVRALFEGQLNRYDHEHIFCDNSSTDGTVAKLQAIAERDKRVKIIVNSRNFGALANIFNGLTATSGDAVVVMLAADLQDPPAIMTDFVRLWEQGYEVVYGIRQVREENWLLPTAMHLFDTALARAWDAEHGGISYGFAPDGSVCDGDKYFWVQAESLAAAALLHARTGLSVYDDWYGKLWAYAWQHFVDHNYGAWYRILTHDNRKIDDEKSPAGKTDYHTMGACYELLNVLPPR